MPRKQKDLDFAIHVDKDNIIPADGGVKNKKKKKTSVTDDQKANDVDEEKVTQQPGADKMADEAVLDKPERSAVDEEAPKPKGKQRKWNSSGRKSDKGRDDPEADIDDAYDAGNEDVYQESTHTHSRRESKESHPLSPSGQGHWEGGDSSSHHEGEDDVFSDGSPRSSMGSVDVDGVGDRPDSRKAGEFKSDDYKSELGQQRRQNRISGLSDYSQFDQGDDDLDDTDEFSHERNGTPKGTPGHHHPFRTTSAVLAMQMSSPSPSVYSTTPRSGKRPTGLPKSVSRIGSPSVLAQYSPKGRSTPTRFRVQKDSAPLVLLHATLLPLRWAWAGVLAEGGLDLDEAIEGGFRPSEELKGLRNNWRLLQDRMGDTVLERGILLPHPQADYEVLEERLLEALELPLRHRARILECGHYLGPSNISDLYEDEETESEEDDNDEHGSNRRRSQKHKRHWCGTCKCDIRYEDLGPGRVYRVKVYASNGLMRAGAWGACWKEMERVDIEVEPIVEPAVQGELEKLAAWQATERRKMEMAEDDVFVEQEHDDLDFGAGETLGHDLDEMDFRSSLHGSVADRTVIHHRRQSSLSPQRQSLSSPQRLPSSPQRQSLSPQRLLPSSPLQQSPRQPTPSQHAHDADRRRRDEERMREIYGHSSPPPQHQAEDMPEYENSPRHYEDDPYVEPQPQATPASPSQQAYERREERRANNAQQQRRADASLPDLILEAVRVLMRDRRNVAIAALSFLVLMFAIRSSGMAGGVPGVAEREAEIMRSIYLHNQQQKQQEAEAPKVLTSAAVEAEQTIPSAVEILQAASESAAPSCAPDVDVVEPLADVGKILAEPESKAAEPEAATSLTIEGVMSPSQAAAKSLKKKKEKKTVRVFETITETVKVRATETVSAQETVAAEAEEEEEEEDVVETEVVTQTQTVMLPAETDSAHVAETEAAVVAVVEEGKDLGSEAEADQEDEKEDAQTVLSTQQGSEENGGFDAPQVPESLPVGETKVEDASPLEP